MDILSSLPNINSTNHAFPKESNKNTKRRREKSTTPKEAKAILQPHETLAQNTGSSRGEIEKIRRLQMKDLCSNLESLIPPLPPTTTSKPKEKAPSIPETLDRSVDYIRKLKERVDQLKMKRDELKEDLVVADVQVHERDSVLDVTLVTGLNKGFILHKIVKILVEEGAQIVSANHSRLADKIVYSVVSQAFSARIGIATSRVHERLKILVGMSTFVLLPGPNGIP